ncbi:MAG TPA: acyl carrier protein [Candidatus Thioglobus autotrophicus]|jgi:acyl carrier protein|nr:acyl carrier protein [Candidatus Thioglobus autotrophicus]
MSNKEKLINSFVSALGVDQSIIIDSLEYNTIPQWDSVAHMALIAALEEEFDIMMDTDDIIDMSSVVKAKEIVSKYDVVF